MPENAISLYFISISVTPVTQENFFEMQIIVDWPSYSIDIYSRLCWFRIKIWREKNTKTHFSTLSVSVICIFHYPSYFIIISKSHSLFPEYFLWWGSAIYFICHHFIIWCCGQSIIVWLVHLIDQIIQHLNIWLNNHVIPLSKYFAATIDIERLQPL